MFKLLFFFCVAVAAFAGNGASILPGGAVPAPSFTENKLVMYKIYLLLAFLATNTLLHAQTANFNFTINSRTRDVHFVNTSQHLGEGEKKAVWSFGDGSSTTTGAYQNTSHRYATAGTFTACLKIYKKRSGSSILLAEACKQITIPAPPQACEAGFQWLPDGAPSGKTIKFSGEGHSNPAKAIKEVCWNFGDGTKVCQTVTSAVSASDLLRMRHTYAQNGTYNACIRIVYEGGCVAEKCKAITVTATPEAACKAEFNIQPVVGAPLGRRFLALPGHSQQKKPVRICWKFGDGSAEVCKEYAENYAGDYPAEHVYAGYGEYEVCVSIKYRDGCEKKKCKVVAVRPAAPPAGGCSAAVLEVPVANAAVTERRFRAELMRDRVAKSICWNFGDGKKACTDLANPVDPKTLTAVHQYTSPGRYTVCARIVYDGGCVVERRLETVIGGNVHPKVAISPNPVVSNMTIVFQSVRQQQVSIEIYNSFGMMLRRDIKNAVLGTNTWTFDAGTLPRGTYSLVVRSPNQFATLIFSKQ